MSIDDVPQPIKLSLSKAWHNKQVLPGFTEGYAQSASFKPTEVTPNALADHILSGGKWAPGYFSKPGRSNDTFLSARLLVLDMDANVSVAEALAVPFIRQYAAIVHPTPSSGQPDPERDPSGAPVMKTRAIFILDEDVEGAERWRALGNALIDALPLPIDEASSKPAQPYAGSTNRVEEPCLNLAAVLPVAVAAELLYDRAVDDYLRATAPRAKTSPVTGNRAEAYAARAFDGQMARLHAAPAGERNETLYHVARALFSMALGGWPGIDEAGVQAALEAYANQHPNTRKSLSTIKSGRKNAVALPLELPERTARKVPRPFDLPVIDADIAANLRYVSDVNMADLPEAGALLVKSPMNTGKTRLAARLINRLAQQLKRRPRVLVITHRQALAANLTKRLNAEEALGGLLFECYKGLTGAQLRQVDRLVICSNSLPKLAGQGEKAPEYDLIIVDEVEQVLKHFDSSTFERGEAAHAYIVLRQLVRSAQLIVGMDAHVGSPSRTWLAGVLGQPVKLLHNTFVIDRGALVLHDHYSTLIQEVNRLVDENAGVVVIPTNSIKRAKKLARYYINRLGEDAVYHICSENSEGREAQAFIESINDRLPALRVFIYTPSLGTGVDIQARVRAVCAWFNANIIDAPELHQMIGRCRNTQETHVYIQDTRGDRAADWQAIYKRHEQNAIRTGQLCPNDDGVFDIPDVQKSLLRLLAMVKAEQNRSLNNLRGHFLALAEGYQVSNRDGTDAPTMAALSDSDSDQAAQDKAAVLAAAPVTADQFERLRDKGELQPEHRAGREKDKMLQAAGLEELTESAYDDLHTPQKRAAVIQFADLADTAEAMQAIDREQAREGVPLNKRRHRTGKRALFNRALRAVWGGQLDPALELTELEIETRMQAWMEEDAAQLRCYFEDGPQRRRADHSTRALAVLRWVLNRLRLKLSYRRVRRDGELVYVYHLDVEALQKAEGYRASRLAMLARKRTEQAEKGGVPKPDSPNDPSATQYPTPDDIWSTSPPEWASTPYFEALL